MYQCYHMQHCDNFLLHAQKLAVLKLSKPRIIIEGKTNIEIRFHFYTPIPRPFVFFVRRSCNAKDPKKVQNLRYPTFCNLYWPKKLKTYLEFDLKRVSDATPHNMRHVRNHELLKRYICIEKLKYFPIQSDRSFE